MFLKPFPILFPNVMVEEGKRNGRDEGNRMRKDWWMEGSIGKDCQNIVSGYRLNTHIGTYRGDFLARM